MMTLWVLHVLRVVLSVQGVVQQQQLLLLLLLLLLMSVVPVVVLLLVRELVLVASFNW